MMNLDTLSMYDLKSLAQKLGVAFPDNASKLELLRIMSKLGQHTQEQAGGGVISSDPMSKPFPLIRTGRELKAMNIVLEWVVVGLIPKNSVSLLYGRGGIGKTTLMMELANAVECGCPVFGMNTVKTPVIIVDYENSLAVLSERAKRTGVDGVMFMDSSTNPPQLDKPEWTIFLDLLRNYPGALFVFDTLRSSHSGDENDSRTMSQIMSRMRQLRDAGATVVLLHHTPKGNDRQFKGSGAIFDLCDQTLALYQTAKTGSDQETDDDDDATDKVYRFGTGKKTRYKPHRIFLTFDSEKEIFVLAKNPEDEALECLHAVIDSIHTVGVAKQSEVVKRATEEGSYDFGSEKKIISLLKKGTGRFWTTEKGLHNSTIYHPIQFGSLAGLYRGEKLPNRNLGTPQLGKEGEKIAISYSQQTTINTEFGSLAEGIEKHTEPDDLPVFDV